MTTSWETGAFSDTTVLPEALRRGLLGIRGGGTMLHAWGLKGAQAQINADLPPYSQTETPR